jgi:hypothetical protein
MRNWYAYISGDPFRPESYYLMTVQPQHTLGKTIAAIYAKGTGKYPDDFSASMKTHIANSLGTGINQVQANDAAAPRTLCK